MNHKVVIVFSYAMLILGIFAIIGSLDGTSQGLYGVVGGLLFGTQAVITLWYATKANAKNKKDELAEAVAAELQKR